MKSPPERTTISGVKLSKSLLLHHTVCFDVSALSSHFHIPTPRGVVMTIKQPCPIHSATAPSHSTKSNSHFASLAEVPPSFSFGSPPSTLVSPTSQPSRMCPIPMPGCTPSAPFLLQSINPPLFSKFYILGTTKVSGPPSRLMATAAGSSMLCVQDLSTLSMMVLT
jgi:hypothetical protein